jgi:hypothetical protein
MNLKQLADKVRDAVKGDEELGGPPPASPARPVDWDAAAGLDPLRTSRPLPEGTPLRAEARPPASREPAVREAAPPRPAAPKPEIGRTSDVRLGAPPEGAEGAGRAGRWKASATVPDLTTVYKEAGIESPLHGYGVDKLTDMLASPHLATASRDVRSTAVQVALEAARIPLRDIIDDALLRSKALAAFEADKAFDLQASQMRAERRAQVLRDQVDAFRRQKNAEMDELKRTISESDQALAQLRARKRREEERLHRIVTHFVEPRPAVAAAPAVARPAAPAPPAATPRGPAAPAATPVTTPAVPPAAVAAPTTAGPGVTAPANPPASAPPAAAPISASSSGAPAGSPPIQAALARPVSPATTTTTTGSPATPAKDEPSSNAPKGRS